MAGFVENLLTDVVKTAKTEAGNAVKAFFGSEYLRDYTHASKTFRTNSYQYAPKFKFLFHVYFDINRDLIGSTQNLPPDANFGLTVKNIQLPKYTFDTHVLNQYNRKRVIQTKIKYDPISIKFHDDNGNLLRRLWYLYYTYYFKDATQIDSNITTTNTVNEQQRLANSSGSNPNNASFDLNRRNIYDNYVGSNDWGYIGETPNDPKTAFAASLGVTKAPFFKAINIYGFNQHNFVLYRLINPMITSFSHDTYDYSQGNGVMENDMSLEYETVKYYEGALDGQAPDKIVQRFGEQATYDRTLSPIARPGSEATILGQGGLVAAAGGVLDDIEKGNWAGAIQKSGAAYNTFKNPQNLLQIAKSEAMGAASTAFNSPPNDSNNNYFPTSGSSGYAQNTTTTVNGWLTGLSKPKEVQPDER